MADTLTREQRSQNMRAIHSKDTKPERIVRKVAHSLGYRFRLHRKDLPGKPDLVFPRLRKIIMVNGCFWHGHGCRRGRLPKTNVEYWKKKICRNVERDKQIVNTLNDLGWEVMIIWECEVNDLVVLKSRLRSFLSKQATNR